MDSYAGYVWSMQWDFKERSSCGGLKCQDIYGKFSTSCELFRSFHISLLQLCSDELKVPTIVILCGQMAR
jgi:hypothetical protein